MWLEAIANLIRLLRAYVPPAWINKQQRVVLVVSKIST